MSILARIFRNFRIFLKRLEGFDKSIGEKEKCASVPSHSDIRGVGEYSRKHSSNLHPIRGELCHGRWGEKFSHL